MSKILYPLSLVYGVLSKVDKGLKQSEKLSKPTISVGNLTWGGTGKTPIVIELSKLIIENNKKPAILTRGYGRAGKNAVLLKDGASNIPAKECGDEPLLISRSVSKASVIVGAKRFENAVRFEKEVNPDIYILDDGFQHWKIKRDLDIVCINAVNPFGNGMLIPAGILREKPNALKRAGLIVITNSDMASDEELKQLESKVLEISGLKPIITYYGDYEYKKLNLIDSFDIEQLKTSKNYLLSAIGFSKGFENSIKKSGVNIAGTFELRDHKSYTQEELKKILIRIGKDSCLIITAKDAVKIESITNEQMREKIAVLTVKPKFKTGKEQWQEKILKVLQSF